MLTRWWKTSILNPSRQAKHIALKPFPLDYTFLKLEGPSGSIPEDLPETDLSGMELIRALKFIGHVSGRTPETYQPSEKGLEFGLFGWNPVDKTLQENLLRPLKYLHGEDLLAEYVPNFRKFFITECVQEAASETFAKPDYLRRLDKLSKLKKINLIQHQYAVRPAIEARRYCVNKNYQSQDAFFFFLYCFIYGIDFDALGFKAKRTLSPLPQFAIDILKEIHPAALGPIKLSEEQSILLNYCMDAYHSDFIDLSLWKIAVRAY
jgi:hypothetical protein